MFTGIVQELGTILSLEDKESGLGIRVSTTKSFLEGLKKGASIAVNGCCLTVTQFSESEVFFDIIQQTLRVTNLKNLALEEKVNLERSLKFGDEVGGHILSGHISCTAIAELIKSGGESELKLQCPEEWNKYILEKGYVAINGASLTVAKIDDKSFSVYLIPETLQATNLSMIKKGDKLNIEIDQNTISTFHALESKLAET